LVRGVFYGSPGCFSIALVYLLYADESGDLTDPRTRVFVVAGVAVHEDAVRPLAGAINATLSSFVGRTLAPDLELHGSPMRVGAGVWSQVPQAKRYALFCALLRKLDNWEHATTGSRIEPFVVVMDRNHSQSPTETTYGELLYAFDASLRERRATGDGHNGVLIADESRYEKTLQAWVELARMYKSRPAQDPRRLYALAETPFFIDSKLTRLMQLADLVAHAFYRAYNADDWRWAECALPGIRDRSPRRLIHFTSDETCACPACQRS
jgi:hypothetical protein